MTGLTFGSVPAMIVRSKISSAVNPTDEDKVLPGHEFESMTPAFMDT